MAAMIEIHDLVKRYGKKLALDGISMTVGEGEIVAPNTMLNREHKEVRR